MDAVGLRERKKERTRQALADAALELFTTKGFDATTIEEIAAAADVSPRTFFRYFSTKEEVLFGQDIDHERAFAELIAARPAAEAPLEKLRAVFLAETAGYEEDRERLLRRTRVALGTPSLTATALAHKRAQEDTVVAALLAASPDADEDEIRLVVAVSFAALRVMAERWLANGGTEDLPTLALDVINRLGQGLARR
jgi:AcrR family transcriptional regulator